MVKKITLSIISVLFLLVVYLAFWPVPIEPVSWNAPKAPDLSGAFAVNRKLADLRIVSLGEEAGPEHIAIGKDGKLYAAVESGNILRMNPDGSEQEVFIRTGGRVLGFDFDSAGNLIAADALKGLLSISPDKKMTVLVDKVGGNPILYADAVVVARSGKIYFSDATTRFSALKWGVLEASILDIQEQSATGRVLVYDPAKGTVHIVAKGFSFANGVALSRNEEILFVSETGRYRVWKIPVDARDMDVSAPGSRARVLFENLPGYPDNLMRGQDGKIWLGLVKPRQAAADEVAAKPFMRKLSLRLPRAFWPVVKPYSHVMAFKEDGEIAADLQDPQGLYPDTTGATETADRIYIQSLHAKGLGWLKK